MAENKMTTWPERLLKAAKKRAKDLEMSFSGYIQSLVRDDLKSVSKENEEG